MGWQRLPLSELIRKRDEQPTGMQLADRSVKVIAKISFTDGMIRYRQDRETNTDMILIRPGDLVVSNINAYKGAIGLYPAGAEAPAAATIHYTAYKTVSDDVSPKFLWWLLRSPTFRVALAEQVPGGIKTELGDNRLLPVEVPVPPINRQRLLVAHLERIRDLHSDVEELRESSRRKIDALLPACLRRLSEDIDVDGVLEDILREPLRNGWSPRCDNLGGGTPVLSLGAVTGFDFDPSEIKLTSEPIDPEAEYILKEGDILITRSNTLSLVGHAAIYQGSPSQCIYPDLMIRARVDQAKAMNRFVWYWLQSPLAREFIQDRAKGTSPTMKKISQKTVRAIPFSTNLSLEVQKDLVDRLDAIRNRVETARENSDIVVETRQLLEPSISKHAFDQKLWT